MTEEVYFILQYLQASMVGAWSAPQPSPPLPLPLPPLASNQELSSTAAGNNPKRGECLDLSSQITDSEDLVYPAGGKRAKGSGFLTVSGMYRVNISLSLCPLFD